MSELSFGTGEVDKDRRRVLTAGATVVGTIGATAVAAPFLLSMQPSEKAKTAGAPVEVDLSKLEPGRKITIEWRGKPVWIVHRTPEMLKTLDAQKELADPDSANVEQQPEYAQNVYRSIKPEYLVMLGVCTHLGCSPTFRPDVAPTDLGADWKGGFFCPCHGSRFDLSGRVYKGAPAPDNMQVPPHHYVDESILLIGAA